MKLYFGLLCRFSDVCVAFLANGLLTYLLPYKHTHSLSHTHTDTLEHPHSYFTYIFMQQHFFSFFEMAALQPENKRIVHFSGDVKHKYRFLDCFF